jgi:hypothetical protein
MIMMQFDNGLLPTMPFWQARSFWATLLTVIVTLLNLNGIDLYAITCSAVGACDEAAVLALGDQAVTLAQEVAPAILGVWAWFERRSPHFELGMTKT